MSFKASLVYIVSSRSTKGHIESRETLSHHSQNNNKKQTKKEALYPDTNNEQQDMG